MWGSLVVRSWRGALYQREAARHPEDADTDPSRHDHDLEAEETLRIHQLREIFMAQVAELEDLLVSLVDRIATERADLLPPKTKSDSMIQLSDALKIVRRAVTHTDNLNSLHNAFAMLNWAIARRNQLVHASVHVGYSQRGEYGPREPVIVLLRPIRPDRKPVP